MNRDHNLLIEKKLIQQMRFPGVLTPGSDRDSDARTNDPLASLTQLLAWQLAVPGVETPGQALGIAVATAIIYALIQLVTN